MARRLCALQITRSSHNPSWLLLANFIDVPGLRHWWQARIARQQEIDKSIAARAEFEYLYDKPYPDPKKVRVAGPFTMESLSPHRVLGVDENDGGVLI